MRPVPFNPEYQLALYELQQDRVIGASGQRRLAGLAQRTLFYDDVRLLQEFFRSADRIVQYNRYYANREPLKVTLPISVPAATSPRSG